MIDGHILRLLLSPDGMRESVVLLLPGKYNSKFKVGGIFNSLDYNQRLVEVIQRLTFLFI